MRIMLYLLDEPEISFFVGNHHRGTISHVAKTWLRNLAVTHNFLDGKSLNDLEKDFFNFIRIGKRFIGKFY